jgi:hypothetical protein
VWRFNTKSERIFLTRVALLSQRAGDESGVLPGEAMSMALLADTIEAIKKYVTPEEILALIEAERDRLGQVMIHKS